MPLCGPSQRDESVQVVHLLGPDTDRTRLPEPLHLARAADLGAYFRTLAHNPRANLHHCVWGAGVALPPSAQISAALPASAPRCETISIPRWPAAAATLVLQRRIRNLGGGPTLIHAWSPLAVRWAAPLSAGHCAVLAESDGVSDDLVKQLAKRPSLGWTCPSATAASRLAQSGIPPCRAAIIPSAVSPLGRTAPAVRAALHLSPHDRAVLLIPPITRRSGAFTAMWGALIAQRVLPQIRLIVPAGGREYERIRRMITAAGADAMLCPIDENTPLAELCAAADLAITVPERDTDLPRGLAWAVAAGCPLVVTDTPGVRSWLNGCGRARYAAPHPKATARGILSTLGEVLPNEAAGPAAALSPACRPYEPAAVARAYGQVYANLASRRPADATR